MIRLATLADLDYVKHLANREGYAVGFVPSPAYEAAITGEKSGKRWSLTCNDRLWICEEAGDQVGFLLASFGAETRVTQIAVQEDARRLDRGLGLLDAAHAEGQARGIDGIRAGCADDLDSNAFWEAMGFTHYGTRLGVHYESKRESTRHVNVWRKNASQLWLPGNP